MNAAGLSASARVSVGHYLKEGPHIVIKNQSHDTRKPIHSPTFANHVFDSDYRRGLSP